MSCKDSHYSKRAKNKTCVSVYFCMCMCMCECICVWTVQWKFLSRLTRRLPVWIAFTVSLALLFLSLSSTPLPSPLLYHIFLLSLSSFPALCVGVRLLACASHSSVVFCLLLPLGVCLIFKYGKQPRLPYAHSRRQHNDNDDDNVAIKANKERIIYCSQFKVASMMQTQMKPKRGRDWVPVKTLPDSG